MLFSLSLLTVKKNDKELIIKHLIVLSKTTIAYSHEFTRCKGTNFLEKM